MKTHPSIDACSQVLLRYMSSMKRRSFIGSIAMIMTTLALEFVSYSVVFAEERVLFAFDDGSIPWQDNLKLTLVQAEKSKHNPVLKKGPAGAPDHGHAVLYGTVLKIDGKLRMWYVGMPQTNFDEWRKTRWRPMCYAESLDGITWTKPNLGLVEVDGSKANNACLVESDADTMLTLVDDFLCVIDDREDPDPMRRFKSVFIAHLPLSRTKGGLRGADDKLNALGDAGERRAGSKLLQAADPRTAVMMTAVSPDGLRWKVLGDRPAIAEKLEISGLWKFNGYYYAAGQQIGPWTWRPDGSEATREMVVYRSSDFAHWSSAKARGFSRVGQQTSVPVAGQQTHMGVGVWNRGNVLVGLTGLWQDGPVDRPKGALGSWGVRIDLGLVLSNDGYTFREPVPDFKVLAHGTDDAWDSMALLQAHAFVNEGEQTLFWYSHWDTTGNLQNMEIGLASLRRDGFGYLNRKIASEAGHFVTTMQPASEKGVRLAINVDSVSKDAPLEIQLLDEKGAEIPGYSTKVMESGTHVPLKFASSDTTPANRSFAVRVEFPAGSDAKYYALYLE